MSGIALPAANTSSGVKRAWDSWDAEPDEETKKLFQIVAAQSGKGKDPSPTLLVHYVAYAQQRTHTEPERPKKRARYDEPCIFPLEHWRSFPLLEERQFQYTSVADEYGRLLDAEAIEHRDEAKRERKKIIYREMPAPSHTEEVVTHPEWEYKGRKDLVHVQVARQPPGYPKQYVLFKLKKSELVGNLEPISLMFDDGLVMFAEDPNEPPTITIDSPDETPEDWSLMCFVLFKP